jgi:Tfp pilus assembly protein FimV
LKKLANQVQDLDQKRLDDRKVITEQISKLASLPTNVTPLPPRHSTSTPKPTENNESHDAPATPLSGYEYQVKSGDTLGLIVKAYRDKGVKVTKSKIIAANPKMNPEVLISGTKIFIPDPSAK